MKRLSLIKDQDGYIQWLDQDHYFKLSSERHLIPLLEELNQITKAIVVQEGGDREADSEDDDDEDDTHSDWSTEVYHSNTICYRDNCSDAVSFKAI